MLEDFQWDSYEPGVFDKCVSGAGLVGRVDVQRWSRDGDGSGEAEDGDDVSKLFVEMLKGKGQEIGGEQ